MYTTIEPRLIALLNTDIHGSPESSVSAPSLELPPLQDPNILKASGRRILLEPDASKRNGKPSSSSKLDGKHAKLVNKADEVDCIRKSNDRQSISANAISDRALGASSPQSLRKILDPGHENASTVPSKRRSITENGESEFVQLPQPLKKHRAVKQVVPPIIIGLFEPPPQAALFPPIASSSFHDSHGRNSLNTVQESLADVREDPRVENRRNVVKDNSPVKSAKKEQGIRARRKWTEEETNHLLLGVHKHGVGSWSDILDDAAFHFNGRSGADLKDRFRTCCPAELRGTAPHKHNQLSGKAKTTSSLMSENILIEDIIDDGCSGGLAVLDNKPRKCRAHRKKLEDLAQLGIDEPFRKSLRRARRPFSEEEDREILEGYNCHGSAWSRIQRDPRFHLQTRKPTDLRDRFRNKYPNKLHADEKEKSALPTRVEESVLLDLKDDERSNISASTGQFSSVELETRDKNVSSKEETLGIQFRSSQNTRLSASRNCPRTLEIGTQPSKTSSQPLGSIVNFKDTFGFSDPPSLETADSLPFTQTFDWSGTITAPFTNTMGEMDISRLLLDEPWGDIPTSGGKERPSYTDINSILVSSVEPSGQGFYHMLEEAGQLVDLQDAGF